MRFVHQVIIECYRLNNIFRINKESHSCTGISVFDIHDEVYLFNPHTHMVILEKGNNDKYYLCYYLLLWKCFTLLTFHNICKIVLCVKKRAAAQVISLSTLIMRYPFSHLFILKLIKLLAIWEDFAKTCLQISTLRLSLCVNMRKSSQNSNIKYFIVNVRS